MTKSIEPVRLPDPSGISRSAARADSGARARPILI
jgi:hypothetical protein